MNSVQIHLALTHVPVILSLVGLVTLVVAFIRKNPMLTKTSYILLLVAGIAALPVFFSGEGAEEAVENLPGVSGTLIERHEDVAKLAMIFISASGLMALAALLSNRWPQVARVVKFLVLALGIASGGFMVQTAHLGGQIRHTELNNTLASQSENGGGNNGLNKEQGENEDD